MFKLKRPCVNCPFRKGVGLLFQLHPERLEQIRNAPAFQCHKTVEYVDDDSGEVVGTPGDRPQQCAGLMAVLHREGEPNNIMQLAMRLGELDTTALDPDGEAYESWAEVIREHCADHPERPTKAQNDADDAETVNAPAVRAAE